MDKSKIPKWEVAVHVHSISLIMEKLPPVGYESLGAGPDLGTVSSLKHERFIRRQDVSDLQHSGIRLAPSCAVPCKCGCDNLLKFLLVIPCMHSIAGGGSIRHPLSIIVQVKMRDLLVRVGRYPCGSLDVEVSSSGLAIADRRHVPHMPQHLSIITITPDMPDGEGNSSDKFAPWDTVRGFVATNVFMPEFSRLAHRSSFERRHSIRRATSSIGSVLSHRRSSSDKPTSDDRPGLLLHHLCVCLSPGEDHQQDSAVCDAAATAYFSLQLHSVNIYAHMDMLLMVLCVCLCIMGEVLS